MDHSWGVLQASRDGLDHPVLPSPGNHGLYMGNHPIAGLKIQVSEILEFTQIKWPLNRDNLGKWSFTNGCRMIFMGKLIMDSPDLEVANFQTPKWFGGLTGPHDLVTPHELWLLVVHRKVPCFIIYESQGYPKVSGTFGCFFLVLFSKIPNSHVLKVIQVTNRQSLVWKRVTYPTWDDAFFSASRPRRVRWEIPSHEVGTDWENHRTNWGNAPS